MLAHKKCEPLEANMEYWKTYMRPRSCRDEATSHLGDNGSASFDAHLKQYQCYLMIKQAIARPDEIGHLS